jgi:hypothetical protein
MAKKASEQARNASVTSAQDVVPEADTSTVFELSEEAIEAIEAGLPPHTGFIPTDAFEVGETEEVTTEPAIEPTPETVGAFHVLLKTGGEEYETTSDDLVAGLQSFSFLDHTNTETFISVTYKGEVMEKTLNVAHARRLFNNKDYSVILAKQFRLALNAE